MSSGWDWDDTVDYANRDNTDDWAARALTLPVVATPGETFTCNSGNCHVMLVILQTVSGQTLREFAQERREMASFGYLMLNGGAWDGE